MLRYKLPEKLSSVTYPKMNMSRNFFGEADVGSTFCNDPCNAATNFPALCRGVILGNIACSLSRNGATKLQDKLQEKLPSVTVP